MFERLAILDARSQYKSEEDFQRELRADVRSVSPGRHIHIKVRTTVDRIGPAVRGTGQASIDGLTAGDVVRYVG